MFTWTIEGTKDGGLLFTKWELKGYKVLSKYEFRHSELGDEPITNAQRLALEIMGIHPTTDDIMSALCDTGDSDRVVFEE